MNSYYFIKRKLLGALFLATLVTAGCLVSGTFVIVEDVEFGFTTQSGFYWYPVDLQDNEDWADHVDEIDFIDAIGFSFKIVDTSGTATNITVYFAAATGPANPFMANPPPLPSNAVVVIPGLAIPANGTVIVTYKESLSFISDVNAFKAMVKSGRFDYYATSTGGSPTPYMLTEGKVIITVSASDT